MTDVRQDAVDFVKAKPNNKIYNRVVEFEWDPEGMDTYTFPSENELFNAYIQANAKLQPLTAALAQIGKSDMIAGPLPNRPGDGGYLHIVISNRRRSLNGLPSVPICSID
jgi:hypothetical protein